jgi:tRNA threonylcarbamoyl adenosine modification protein YeaZ
VVVDGALAAQAIVDVDRGQSERLAVMAQSVLEEAALWPDQLDAVAVTVGPGSFTGLRAALALAHGIAFGAGRPVVPVSLAEVFAEALPRRGGRTLWTAIDSRRARVFLDTGAGFHAVPLDALPAAQDPVAVAGDAAIAVAARLATRGDDVMLSDARLPWPRHVACAAEKRLAGALPPLAALPLYIDPPEARLPAGGLRPAPLR